MTPAMVPLPAAKERWTMPEKLLCLIMLAFLVPNFSHAMYCGFEAGWWPIKPRDYNLGLAACAAVTILFCRPAFSAMALAILTIPMPRILDAAILQRYEILEYGGHSVYVFTMISLWIISTVGVLSIGTTRGPRIAGLAPPPVGWTSSWRGFLGWAAPAASRSFMAASISASISSVSLGASTDIAGGAGVLGRSRCWGPEG